MVLIIGGKYQGKHDFAAKHFPEADVTEFDDILRATGGVRGFLEKYGSGGENADTVVIADENASGIVPGDAEEIRFREEYNRSLTSLAEKADEVYRVFCGIGMKIK